MRTVIFVIKKVIPSQEGVELHTSKYTGFHVEPERGA